MTAMDNIAPTGKQSLRLALAKLFSKLKALPSMAPASHWLPYICLFLYPIVVLQVKSGGSAALGLLMFSGIYMLVRERVKLSLKPILPLYSCLMFFWFVDFVTAGLAEREPVAGMLSSFTQVHFLLFPVFLTMLCRLKYAYYIFMIGVATSLVLSVGTTFYQLYVLGYWRTSGGVNPIIFSNIVLVFMSIVGLYSLFFKKYWILIIVCLAIFPVVLSLTRGGLIAMFVLAVILFLNISKPSCNWYKSWVVYVFIILVAVGGYLFFDRVYSRVELLYDEMQSYMDGSDVNTSTGQRMLMYRGGLELAANHPWLGVGRENVNLKLAETSVLTEKNASITSFTHLHNEYLTALAGSGVFGLVSLLLLLIVPCILIYRATDQGVFRGQVVSLCALYSVYGLTNLAFDNGTLNGLFMVTLATAFAAINTSASTSESHQLCS